MTNTVNQKKITNIQNSAAALFHNFAQTKLIATIMEIKTNAYQTPSVEEIQIGQSEILCASPFSGNQLDHLIEEEDTNDWSNIF